MAMLKTATLALVLVSCTPTMTYQQGWSAFVASPDYSSEYDAFKKNLGDKRPCFGVSLIDFIEGSAQPEAGCIYVSGPLKVMQAQPDGYMVMSPEYGGAKPKLFIHKTDEQGVVDDAIINSAAPPNFYEYSGVFTYETMLGMSTVHSFRKVTDAVMRAQADLKSYSPVEEIYADRKLWKQAERFTKRSATSAP